MTTRLLTSLAVIGGLTFTAVGARTAHADAPIAITIDAQASRTVTPPASPASADEIAGYADRDAKDTKAASFTGGSVIVIGLSSTAVIVLLVVLILLL